MKNRIFINFITLLVVLLPLTQTQAQSYIMENRYMARILQVTDGVLSTQSIKNKRAHTTLVPIKCDEFVVHFIKNKVEMSLSNKDFKVSSVSAYTNPLQPDSKGYQFQLQNDAHALSLIVYYEMSADDAYCRKHLSIIPSEEIFLKKVDVEAISFDDAYQNYTIKQITAKGSALWKPGLGQPVYTTKSATFWGTEFPASRNEVNNNQITCGYLLERKLDTVYASYNSVIGVSDDCRYMDDAFYAYINKIRKRPLRLQIQYNSWFDYAKSVSKEKLAYSIQKVDNELVRKRGCDPLNAYIIDDGWQDAGKNADWSKKVWTVNNKFQSDFSHSFHAVKQANSLLGLWLSPGCLFGAQPMVPKMRKYGFEALSFGMSMTGETYMQKLEERVLELAKMGISYFKFDGVFGHLNTRDFYLKNNPFPSSNDERLNSAAFDDQKEQYLVAGTERLMHIFNELHEVNPEIFLAITNGAYLSAWWLQYVDVVWLINAGDAAKGDDRTDELVYRDQVYYQIWKEERTKFPMCSIFNHEPKKTQAGEASEAFRKYLYMNLSRGTGFIELYIKTDSLSETDWDIVADGLKWAKKMFPAFKEVRMHGGSPASKAVYGYAAWADEEGYLSMHNPSDQSQKYKIKLDRDLGLMESTKSVSLISSPTGTLDSRLIREYSYGEEIEVELAPKDVIVLDFRIQGTNIDK